MYVTKVTQFDQNEQRFMKKSVIVLSLSSAYVHIQATIVSNLHDVIAILANQLCGIT